MLIPSQRSKTWSIVSMALQLVTIPAHASLGKLKFVALLTVFFQVGNLLGAQPAQESSNDVNQLVHNSTAVVLRLLPEQISVPEQLVSCIARLIGPPGQQWPLGVKIPNGRVLRRIMALISKSTSTSV